MNRLLFLLTFGLTGFAVLVALGVWQMQRLAWKEGIIAEINHRMESDPVPLPERPDALRDKYLPVSVTGDILTGELHVLTSFKNIGAGYIIIAPFRTEDGRRILVERGFVQEDDKNTKRRLGAQAITGTLAWPDETDRFTPAPDTQGNIWFARDVAAMAQALDTEPVLLVAQSQTDAGVTPMPVDTSRIPNDHLQYAITWFSLALIWVAMTAYFLWRPRARKTG